MLHISPLVQTITVVIANTPKHAMHLRHSPHITLQYSKQEKAVPLDRESYTSVVISYKNVHIILQVKMMCFVPICLDNFNMYMCVQLFNVYNTLSHIVTPAPAIPPWRSRAPGSPALCTPASFVMRISDQLDSPGFNHLCYFHPSICLSHSSVPCFRINARMMFCYPCDDAVPVLFLVCSS